MTRNVKSPDRPGFVRSTRHLRRVIVWAMTSACLIALSAPYRPTVANDADRSSDGAREEAETRKVPRHTEVWIGADVGRNHWLVYSGTTLAPFGDIHSNGLRLRFTGGYGGYRYDSFQRSTRQTTEFAADVTFADALVGYLWRLDPLILKLFAGASYAEHRIAPHDALNQVQGPDVGAKVVAEAWFNIGESAFASLDLAFSTAHESRSARGRLGYRLTPSFTFGPEVGVNLDRQGDYKINEEDKDFRTEQLDYARIGVFARQEWYGGELSASAGFLGDFREEKSPYATVNWISQF